MAKNDNIYYPYREPHRRHLFGPHYLLLLIVATLGACADQYYVSPVDADNKSLQFTYEVNYERRPAIEYILEVEDSVLRFYPDSRKWSKFQIRHLLAEECATVNLLSAGVLKYFGYEALQGNFKRKNVDVKFSVCGYSLSGEVAEKSPADLNRYLLTLVSDLPVALQRSFDFRPRESTVYNDGKWNKLELQLLYSGSHQCYQQIIVTPSILVDKLNGDASSQIECGLSEFQRRQLTDAVKYIDLQTDYEYWVETPYVCVDCPDYGIRMLVNDRPVAVIDCMAGMPTNTLENFYRLICEYSPRGLLIEDEFIASEP